MSISNRFEDQRSSARFIRSCRDNPAFGFSHLVQITLALVLFSKSVAPGSAQSAPVDILASPVPKTAPLGIAVWNWMGATVPEKALRDLPTVEGTPTQAITAVSGAAWTENGEKGNLRVEIAWDFQQDSPGISEENLSRIESAVREGDVVLADLSAKAGATVREFFPTRRRPNSGQARPGLHPR